MGSYSAGLDTFRSCVLYNAFGLLVGVITHDSYLQLGDQSHVRQCEGRPSVCWATRHTTDPTPLQLWIKGMTMTHGYSSVVQSCALHSCLRHAGQSCCYEFWVQPLVKAIAVSHGRNIVCRFGRLPTLRLGARPPSRRGSDAGSRACAETSAFHRPGSPPRRVS